MPKTDNQKQHILNTALKLFSKQGYDATPISLIAREAGVSQGLMYNFFDSKESLLRAMVSQGFQDINESMKAYGIDADPGTAIRNHVNATVTIIQKKNEFWRLLHGIRLQGKVLETVEPQFALIVSEVTKKFEKVFKLLGYPNPKMEALLFLTQIDGMVILYLQSEKTPLKKMAAQLIKRYTA